MRQHTILDSNSAGHATLGVGRAWLHLERCGLRRPILVGHLRMTPSPRTTTVKVAWHRLRLWNDEPTRARPLWLPRLVTAGS